MKSLEISIHREAMINKYFPVVFCLFALTLLLLPTLSEARGGGGGGGRAAVEARETATSTTTGAEEAAAATATTNAPEAATSSAAAEPPLRQFNPVDPYEPFNRVMFHFNDFVDHAVLKPIATLYNKIVPKPILKGISNIFFNIDTLPTFANDLLQANFYQATSDAWRIVINTTIGIGGFFDPATSMGLERNSQDLGLTFARWGWRNSDYLVLPFLGPTTVRDGLAWPINYQYLTIYPHIYPIRARYELYGLNLISKRADLLRFQGVIEQASVDKYVFMRDAFVQSRRYRIEQNDHRSDPYLEKNDAQPTN